MIVALGMHAWSSRLQAGMLLSKPVVVAVHRPRHSKYVKAVLRPAAQWLCEKAIELISVLPQMYYQTQVCIYRVCLVHNLADVSLRLGVLCCLRWHVSALGGAARGLYRAMHCIVCRLAPTQDCT